MRRRARRRKRHGPHVASEIELMPMINVFMAIIPMLLLSAAFVPVTVIETTLPIGAPAAEVEKDAPLDLAILIHPEAYVVRVNGEVTHTIGRPAGEGTEAREALKAALAAIAGQHAGHREVRIVSLPTTRYEEIVEVMDLSRAAGLPEAALADASLEAS